MKKLIYNLQLMCVVILSATLLSNCMPTYDRQGNPVLAVDPGAATILGAILLHGALSRVYHGHYHYYGRRHHHYHKNVRYKR